MILERKATQRKQLTKRKSWTPWATENYPTIDIQMHTNLLKVVDQMPSRIVDQIRCRLWLTSTSLINHNNTILWRFKELSIQWRTTTSWSTVNHQNRVSIRVAFVWFLKKDFLKNEYFDKKKKNEKSKKNLIVHSIVHECQTHERNLFEKVRSVDTKFVSQQQVVHS